MIRKRSVPQKSHPSQVWQIRRTRNVPQKRIARQVQQIRRTRNVLQKRTAWPFQVDQNDPAVMNLALNNATNVIEYYRAKG